MPELETLPAETTPATESVPQTDEPTVAHIVKVGPGESAAAAYRHPIYAVWRTSS